MSPSRSEPRTNPPKARSALIRSSSASLRSSSDSSAVNWLQSVSPSISMRNAMMRTRVTSKSVVAVADTTPSASAAKAPASSPIFAGSASYSGMRLIGMPSRSTAAWRSWAVRSADAASSGARIDRFASWSASAGIATAPTAASSCRSRVLIFTIANATRHPWRDVASPRMPHAVPLLERYRDHLPVTSRTPRLTLGEGGTPLVRAPALERETGIPEIWLKVEGANPTGSFKDRGMVLAVAKAVEDGARAVLCASTGNTAASAAAYAARAGVPCSVILPAGYVALGKLSQALAFGARVVTIRGTFDDALRITRELAGRGEAVLVNSVNPNRIEGQKTAAFEICETLGDAPEALFIPVGKAGNITAYWKGFREAAASGLGTRRPVMRGFQAAGAAPLVSGAVVAEPKTVATAIRIGNPASWTGAIQARDESGGSIEAVTEEAILDAYGFLARCE